jgi:DNA-binding MarR family transcriptional regulator
MNDVTHRRLVDEAISQLRQLLAGASVSLGPAWFDLDLTKGQVRTLFALHGGGGATSLSALADRLGVSAPTASVVVDQLVQRGYVERTTDVADRRRVLLHVADPGEVLLAGLTEDRRLSLQTWLEHMTDEELEQLCVAIQPLILQLPATSRST